VNQRTSRLVWGGALLIATGLALLLPLVLPLSLAAGLSLLGAGALFWGADRRAGVPKGKPEAVPTVVPLTVSAPPEAPSLERHEGPPAPDLSGPRVRALENLSWTLHQAIIGRIRSLLAPLSDSLFGIKSDLRGLLSKAGQLENSFRNDANGLHQTVGRFETQSVTIRTFAGEMDRSVHQFEVSSQAMGARLGQITEAIQQINDVAERIKVLSINASIEAARAGQQGAGFKVISQEVRKLAEDTNQFSAQAEKTITESIAEIQAMFRRFISQYQGRAHEIHQIESTTQELETFLKGLFSMIEGIFQDYDGFVGSLESNLDQVSPTLQQAEIGTQQIENTWKGIREYIDAGWGTSGTAGAMPPDEALKMLQTFSRHLTTPLEAEVVDEWARRAGIPLASNKKHEEDITLF